LDDDSICLWISLNQYWWGPKTVYVIARDAEGPFGQVHEDALSE